MYDYNNVILETLKKYKNQTDTKIARSLIGQVKEFKNHYGNRIETLRKRVTEVRNNNNIKRDKKEIKTKVVIEKEFEEDKKSLEFKEDKKTLLEKYKHSVKTVSRLERLLDFKKKIESEKLQSINIGTSKTGSKIEQGCAIALFSDLHFEERIESKKINGFNEFSPEIATKRCTNYFSNLAKRIDKERRDIKIDSLVFASLGDLIHGFIHEEYMSSNYMMPMEASFRVFEILVNGLEFILKDKELKEIKFVGKVGNHSRTTFRPYTTDEALMSYEWSIYKHLENIFKKETRLNFLLDESYFSYIKVYDKICRFHHGHNIQYRGGIGGLTIPLIKYIHRANQQIQADMDFIGHFHTRFNLPNCLVNGSICGFDGYALKIGASPEVPTQQFQILDSRRGFTTNTPILTTE